ncbi:MAG: hypothetical protein ACTSVI_16135 [Promethearchaeota archaeon]
MSRSIKKLGTSYIDGITGEYSAVKTNATFGAVELAFGMKML